MPDYKSMYIRLFNNVTKAIELLQDGQREAEQIYLEGNDLPDFMAEKPLPDRHKEDK